MTVAVNKRKGISHLSNLSLSETRILLRSLLKDSLKVSLKIDGLGFRFGKDSSGRPFVESSNSGPIFDPEEFTRYAIKKNPNDTIRIDRATAYTKFSKALMESSLMKAVPNNTKIVAEVLSKDLGELSESGNEIKFVHLNYSVKDIGSIMTVVLVGCLAADTGEPIEFFSPIFEKLKSKSNAIITVLTPFEFEVGPNKIENIQEISSRFDSIFEHVTDFRSKENRAKKQDFEEIKEQIEYHLAKSLPKVEFVGTSIHEGFVISTKELIFKITSNEFRKIMAMKAKGNE